MAKRAHGEGSIRQRPNGSWEARLSYPDPETGRIQSISLYDKTAEAVRAKLDEARERIKANAPAQDSPQRLSEWLPTGLRPRLRHRRASWPQKHAVPQPFPQASRARAAGHSAARPAAKVSR